MKTCRTCGETKATTEFHRSSAARDGLQGFCKPCHNAANRQVRERNPNYRVQNAPPKPRTHIPNKGVHSTIQRAVSSGALVRPSACEHCGREGKVHGHHEDYAKPLDVHWLCPRCHRRVHAGLIQLAGVQAVQE